MKPAYIPLVAALMSCAPSGAYTPHRPHDVTQIPVLKSPVVLVAPPASSDSNTLIYFCYDDQEYLTSHPCYKPLEIHHEGIKKP